MNTEITYAEVAEIIKFDSLKDPIEILVVLQLVSLKKKAISSPRCMNRTFSVLARENRKI